MTDLGRHSKRLLRRGRRRSARSSHGHLRQEDSMTIQPNPLYTILTNYAKLILI